MLLRTRGFVVLSRHGLSNYPTTNQKDKRKSPCGVEYTFVHLQQEEINSLPILVANNGIGHEVNDKRDGGVDSADLGDGWPENALGDEIANKRQDVGEKWPKEREENVAN